MSKRTALIILLVSVALMLPVGAAVAQATFTGLGADNSLSTGANWQAGTPPANTGNETLIFIPGPQTDPADVSPWSVAGLEFNGLTAPFTLTTPQLKLHAGGVLDTSSNRVHLNGTVRLMADQTWQLSDRFYVTNDLYNSGRLTVTGTGDLFLQGNAIGGTIFKENRNLSLYGLNTCGLRLRSPGTLTIHSPQPVAPGAVVDVEAPSLIQLLAGPVTLDMHLVALADITLKSLNNDRTGLRCSDDGVGGGADVTVTKTGSGTVELSSGGFRGTVFVQQGTLALNNPGTLTPFFTGPLLVGDGSGGANADVLRVLSSNMAGTDTLIVAESGFVDINADHNDFGHIYMTGGQIRAYRDLVVFQNYPYVGAGTVETFAAATTATIGGSLAPLLSELVLQVADGAADPDLDLASRITGLKPLIKNGPGQLRLSLVGGGAGFANSLGGIVVNEGTVELAGGTSSVAKTDIQVGDGLGGVQVDVLALAGNYQINTTTDTLLVTRSGLVQMNGFTDQVGQIVLDGGTIAGGGGRLGVYGGVTSVASSVTSTLTDGSLDLLGGETLFTVPDGANAFDLNISAVGSPNFGARLRKVGAGRLTLGEGSSLTGSTIVDEGELAYFSTTANNQFSGPALRMSPGTAFYGFAADISVDTLAVPSGVVTSLAHSDLHLSVVEGDLNTSTSSLSILGSPGALDVSGSLALGTDTLTVNLAGTAPGSNYDQIRATTAITTSGTLRVGLLNGFFPSISDTFVILTAPNVTGTFSGIDMSALGGPQLAIAYLSDSVILYGVAGSPVEQPDPLLPAVLTLNNNYPNPFNPMTTISFDLPSAAPVNLTIYDISGRVVSRLVNTTLNPGRHEVIWPGTDDSGRAVSSGTYLSQLRVGNQVRTQKLALVE